MDHNPQHDAAAAANVATLRGQATAEQIAAWKEKHKLGIYGIEVKGHIGYFKMPNFEEMNYGYSKLDREKMLEIWQAFASTTWLGGSEEILSNPTLFAGAMRLIQKKVDGAEAELVDL